MVKNDVRSCPMEIDKLLRENQIGTLLENQKLTWNSKSVETTTNTGAY